MEGGKEEKGGEKEGKSIVTKLYDMPKYLGQA